LTVDPVVYLKVDIKFFKEKFTQLEKQLLTDTEKYISKMKNKYEECPYVYQSVPWLNFVCNQKYSESYSSDFLNLSFQLDQYREYMDFNVMFEFNQLKSKQFIDYEKFSKVYREAKQQAGMPNSKIVDLVTKLKPAEGKTSLILISGIPGSGKGRAADYLARQLKQENLTAASFKMPTVQDSTVYNSEAFIAELLAFSKDNSENEVIVATLPSYNHLKKTIFDLTKNEKFSGVFDIKYVLTKVNARNFYMNKNRNCFQYMIENTMKGISNAVILERGDLP
jgi:hypothetical protein